MKRRFGIKLCVIAVVLLLCVALVACGDSNANNSNKNTAKTNTGTQISDNGNNSGQDMHGGGNSDTDGTQALAFSYESITENGEIVSYNLTSVTGGSGEIVIPSLFSDKPVTGIAGEVFHRTTYTKVIVPDTVTSIGDRCFSLSYDLEEVIFSEHSELKSIGNRAFYECNSLVTVTLPDGVEEVGDEAFSGTSVKSLNITDALVRAGRDAFYDISANKTGYIVYGKVLYKYVGSDVSAVVPSGVVSIASGAFENNSVLTSISIPASVTHIGKNAFDGIANLSEIEVDADNAVYSSQGNCLVETESGTLVYGTVGAVISSEGNVVAIADYAFKGINIKSLDIPGNVKTIGEGAFYNAKELTSVTLPESLESIGANVFSGAEKLEEIVIPARVRAIDGTAFSGCESLKTVTVDSVWVYLNANMRDDVGHLLDKANTVYVRQPDVVRNVCVTEGNAIVYKDMTFAQEVEYLSKILTNASTSGKESDYLTMWFTKTDSDKSGYDKWVRNEK